MDQRATPLGYLQLTSLGNSTALVNTGNTTTDGILNSASLVRLTPEAQAIRFRDDGVAPTATVGQPLAVGTTLEYMGTMSAVKIIEQTGGAKVNASFYKIAGM